MKIVVLDGYTENPGDLSWEGFEQLGELTVYDRTPEDKIVERIGNAEAVIVNKAPITRQTLELCPNVRYIGVLATGYNVVDTEAARKKKIPVCNIPTYGTDAVAQYTIALLLEICHHVAHHSAAVHEGRWSNNIDWCFWDYPLIELADKKLGIIGYGRIGRAVARIAQAFGMEILPYDGENTAGRDGLLSLNAVLEKADIITLHCPLMPDTKGIINKETIAKMKDGVILLNDSRGPLVVEEDLAEALNSGKVYAAAMDVVSAEPIQQDNPLLKAKNCIITPHIAWAPKESRERLMRCAVDNLAAFLSGHPQNVVNETK